jgi:hypothetical protein
MICELRSEEEILGVKPYRLILDISLGLLQPEALQSSAAMMSDLS